MLKHGIRFLASQGARLASQGVRHLRANMRPNFQTPRPLFCKQLWETSSNRNSRLYFTLCALDVATITSTSCVHARAESYDENTIVGEQELVTEQNDGRDDTTTKADYMRMKVATVKNILDDIMDSRSWALLYGLVGANVAIYSAFSLAFFLNRPPKPSATLLRFLSRNFVLSLGWLSRGRWHVMLTCMFAHLTFRHLTRNMWAIFTGVWVCSRVMDVWHIVAVYFGGGLVGASSTMWLTKILRKPRYVTEVTGASDGIYALYYYWLCVANWERLKVQSVPLEPIAKGYFLYVFVSECVGLRKYVRYGYTGTGRNLVRGNHAAHLGGAVTGLLAYGVPRILQNMGQNDSSGDENEGTEQEGRAEGYTKTHLCDRTG